MKNLRLLSLVLVGAVTFYSCSDSELTGPSTEVSDLEMQQLRAAGFDVDNFIPFKLSDGTLIAERDIIVDFDNIRIDRLPTAEQYSTNNLVNAGGGRVITLYAPEEGSDDGGGGGGPGNGNGNGGGGGNPNNNGIADAKGGKGGGGGGSGYSPAMIAGLDEAISRYNSQNLSISFMRVTSSSGADIVMTRLSSRDESRGVLGSAGFPTASGDPYGEIKMSGILESTYGLSTNGIATIIAHEMGHCIGLRHTDYFDRSISCGGSPSDEGEGSIGANHIPGTPTGADTAGNGSYMLACTDGSNRSFTNADKTALDYLY